MLADIVVYSTLVVVWDYVASAAKATSWATWSGHPMRFIVLALVIWVLVENRRFKGPPIGDEIARRKAAIAAAEAAVGEKG